MAFGDVGTDTSKLEARIAELEAGWEQERVRLAGCAVACGSREDEVKPGDFGHSASYDDVRTLYRKYEAERKAHEATRADAVAALEWAAQRFDEYSDTYSDRPPTPFARHARKLADQFRETDDAPVEDGE